MTSTWKTLSIASLVIGVAAEAKAWDVQQLNPEIPSSSWGIVEEDREIRITVDEGTKPFIFRAFDDDVPGNPAADITLISTTMTSGEIHLQVGQPGFGNEGATELREIAIDNANITSVIEGIYITGDFLAAEAMTVDQIHVGRVLRPDAY